MLQVRVELDLIDGGRDGAGLEEDVEVVREVVADADGLGQALALQVLHLAPAGLVLGAVVAVRAVDHWARIERAMRTGVDLPVSRFPAVLAIVVALGAVLLVAAVLVQAVR